VSDNSKHWSNFQTHILFSTLQSSLVRLLLRICTLESYSHYYSKYADRRTSRKCQERRLLGRQLVHCLHVPRLWPCRNLPVLLNFCDAKLNRRIARLHTKSGKHYVGLE